MEANRNKVIFKANYKESTQIPVVDFIASKTNLSKIKIKKAQEIGGLWVKPKGEAALKRCRRAKTLLQKGDRIEFYFDEGLLQAESPENLVGLGKSKNWQVWVKPSGMPTQGTKFADRNSFQYIIEKNKDKRIFLIHRLDLETLGLIFVVYKKSLAGEFSKLWTGPQVSKVYWAQCKGKLPNERGVIKTALDEKPAETHYQVIDSNEKTSILRVEIKTGRLHQIRRHLDSIGFPVIGDPKYGTGNKNSDGLQLIAAQLCIQHPEVNRTFTLPEASLPEGSIFRDFYSKLVAVPTALSPEA